MKTATKILPLFLLLITILGSVFVVPKLTFDDSLQEWVPPNELIVKDYQLFLREFAGDALLIVSFPVPQDSPSHSTLQAIDGLMHRIGDFHYVHSVLRWPPPFLRLKKSPNPNIQAYAISYSPPSYANPNRPALIQQIADLLDSSGLEYHIAGTGVIHKAMNEETRHATRRFLGIGLTALFGLMFFLTKHLRTVLKTISISLGAVCGVVLTAYFFDIQFNMIMAILPILILFYSSSIAIHVLNHQGNFRTVFWPSVTAILTTCAGFATFLFESAPLLRKFAILAIVGLLSGFLWAVLFFLPDRQSQLKPLPFKNQLSRIRSGWKPEYLGVGLVLLLLSIPLALRHDSSSQLVDPGSSLWIRVHLAGFQPGSPVPSADLQKTAAEKTPHGQHGDGAGVPSGGRICPGQSL